MEKLDTKNDEKKNKARKFNLGPLAFEETIIVNTHEKYEANISLAGKSCRAFSTYNESRIAFHTKIEINDKTMSLSFFPSKMLSYKAILMSLCSLHGIVIKTIPEEILRGIVVYET